MTTKPWPSEEFKPPEWSPIRWALKAWVWIVLLAAALIAEVVAGPLLAALILAFKFGGSDLALGIWLRHRGAPALCYFAWAQAFLKVAVVGCMLAIAIAALEPLFGVPFDPMRFIGALMLLFTGAFVGSVTTFAAVVTVPSDPHRLWLGNSAYGDLLANRWPLSCMGDRNRVPALLVLGQVEVIVVSVLFLLGLTLHAYRTGQWWQSLISAVICIFVGIRGVSIFSASLREVTAREQARAMPDSIPAAANEANSADHQLRVPPL